ncbi:MAG: VirB4 family type IV secretion/conjugal transfer ATPase [Rickettsiales bacterium]
MRYKIFNLNKAKSQKHRYAKREYAEASFIPYKYLWNERTVLLKDDSLLQVVKLGGFSFETADDEDVDMRKSVRNTLWKGLSGASNVSVTFHIVRRRCNVFGRDSETNMPPGFPAYLERKWREKHKSHHSFINELYISVVRKKSAASNKLEEMVAKLKEKTDRSQRFLALKEAAEDLEEITRRIVATLRDYKPQVLGVRKTKYGYFSELAEFLGVIVNGGAYTPMQVPTMDLSHYLPTHRLYFAQRVVEFRGPEKRFFGGIVSIKEYCAKTSSTMMDSFLQMPFEFVMTQSFDFMDRNSIIIEMKIQQGRMVNTGDVAVSQVEEINEALDDTVSGRVGFGKHHFSMLCTDATVKGLENVLAMAATELNNIGVIPVRERVNLEPAYWAQLPGNASSYAVRAARINTLNLSGFAPMHNYPTGKQKGNFWGEYVTVLDTTSSTPYYFSFHVRDVGHTTIIGPTGAGKTVLMNFLCAQARKFHCNMFFFDKDRGAEIFIRAIGGVYTLLSVGSPCGFNPLQLEDTSENRSFIREWMAMLVSCHGEQVTSDDIDKINSAISGNFKLRKEDRRLHNVAPFLGIGGPGSLANRMSIWHGEGSHAGVFDNPEDTLDFSKNMIFGFEMGEILKDKLSISPILAYIFHKIGLSLDGTPSMIVLDEAWALIDNDVFAPKIKDWLKVLRKLNCFVIFATQSVEDASKSRISDTLIQQTATQIFLPNLKATEVYRTSFMLSQREFTLIKTTDPGSRFFLVKQGVDAVVARVDLSGMEDVIEVLSGRADTVLLLDEVRADVGDDPAVWLPVFWERVKKI